MTGFIRPQVSYRTIFTEPDVHVFEANDLPSPDSGTITLENKVYRFHGFVNIGTNNLDISNSPVFKGQHGGSDGIIYTGGGDMLTGTDGAFFAADLTFDAPGGTMFNISANANTEMLVESCSFADPANLGNLASLGTIDGYRVPTFKGCNFEDFDGGLTFTGTSDKIFLSECPLRGVTASNVTIVTLDANCDTDIVDFTDSYVKGVQSDTEVVNVDASATISDIFQYRGITHDNTVTKSNILNGAAGVGEVGYRVTDSYPLSGSKVVGELNLDSTTTVNITNTTDFFAVGGSTTLGNETQRVQSPSGGTLEYIGKKDVNVSTMITATIDAPSGDIVEMGILKNGTIEPASINEVQGQGNAPVFIAANGVEDLVTNDTIEMGIRNNDGADVNVREYNITFIG